MHRGATAFLRLFADAVPAISLSFLLSSTLILLFTASAWSATPAGTAISNVATATFTSGAAGGPVTVSSNPASVTSVVRRTTAVIEYLQYAPTNPAALPVTVAVTAYSSGTTTGSFTPLGPPVPAGGGTPMNLADPVLLVPASQYHTGEPVFLRLTDGDQNNDPDLAETVLITIQDNRTADSETLRLTESGPNTGVFTGHVQTGPGPAATGSGVLNVVNDSRLDAAYTDIADATDTHAASVLVDPYGIAFDSTTGLPVNGVSIMFVDAGGAPAAVYGDDGISIFPSTVVTGGTTTDSSGRTYVFPAGGFRFPFIRPGTYQFLFVTPPGYRAPSVVPTSVLQGLRGAPFAVDVPGSRGEQFVVNAGPAIRIDVPVDPIGSGLWLMKTAGKLTASVGDFVPYRVTVENPSSTTPAPGVTVNDLLPHGFRYRKGSARLDGAVLADPVIAADGRGLAFTVGALAPGAHADITYVAEVGAGARPGEAVNSAVAGSQLGTSSNIATATVMVTEDLFRSKATIVGQVIVDGCGDKERSEQGGLAGIRIYREDGTFAVTDQNGMYHFAAVTPGTHVIQLDTHTVPAKYEVMACEENTRFAGSATSQFADLQGGTLWRADFHLGLRPKQFGEVGIEITTAPKKAGTGGPAVDPGRDLIEYTVPMRVGVVPARNLKLSIILPEGVEYRKGSAIFTGRTSEEAGRADGVMTAPAGVSLPPIPLDEPQETEGAITFRFAEVPANWEGKLVFDAAVPLDGREGKQLPTAAVLTSDSPEGRNNRTPAVNTALIVGTRDELRPRPDIVLRPQFLSGSADLTRQDKLELDGLIKRLKKAHVDQITVTGHTDSRRISKRLQARYPDNYALSYARAATIGAYLANGLGLTHDQVTYEGKGPDQPEASNETEEGRARNRRVELKICPAKQRVQVPALKSGPPSGMKAVATLGLRPGEIWPPDQSKLPVTADVRNAPLVTPSWVSTQQPGLALIWPPDGQYASLQVMKVIIKHDPDRLPKLVLNGAEVDPLFYDTTVRSEDGSIAVSTWRSVQLAEGQNTIEAVDKDGDGAAIDRLSSMVYFSGVPEHAVLVPEKSRLSADGKTTPVVAVRFTDRDGRPAREGLLGEFTVDPPHLPRKRVEALLHSPIVEVASEAHRFTIGEDGVALIELEPTTQTGTAVLRIPLAREKTEIRAWLAPEDRDWILVGLAEGTFGYNTVKGNMETFGAGGGDNGPTDDSRVAFYAKGRIKGDWLLTVAYDSARRQGRDPQGLFQVIDPNKYYLLYGDGTEQQADAASAKSLYVKIERGQFYALFGDYATGMTVTELSRYSRTFTGFKSEMKGDWYEYNVFAADTNQAFIKDEIPGDGTSGLYRLSRKNIVLGSERVTIEVRDRFHSEVIVSSQHLSRFLDYTIDYESGAIFFKQPVFSHDGNFNPIYIVAEYESFDSADSSLTYGGRGAVKLGNRVEVGATHVHEGRVGGSGDLDGVDAAVDLGGGTRLRAEAAATKTEQAGTAARTAGSAYLAEVTHRSEKMEGRAYVREQAAGFGLGQQNGSETGTRKVGLDLNYRLTSTVSAGGEAFRQENLGTGAVRDVAEVRARYAAAQYEFLAGLRHAEDSFVDSEAQRSEQVYFGARYQLTERTTLRFKHEQSVGGYNANGDYPTRTTLGADYRLNQTATLFADQEWTRGSNQDSTTSRIGIKAAPWTGGQISSTMEQQVTENGVRLFSTAGLKQGWQLDKNWSLDAGLDRSTTLRHPGNTPLNVNVPPASGGTEDFTAVSLGAGYRQEKWSWTGRAERRISDSEEKTGVLMGANGEPRPGIGLAAGLQLFTSDYVTGAERRSGDLRFGLAYRPREARWIVLDRLDYLVNEQKGSGTDYDSRRFVNNIVANYASGNRVQVSLQYGAKYVLETIDSTDYSGYTDLTGLELRYDLTKRWDIGVRGSMLHSWSIGQTDYGTSVSTGFNLGRNFWISVGYNITGFRDRDFSRADFTSEGPFIKFRFKFDQASAREAIKWFTGQ